jgi:hypothetical protein
MYYSSYQSLCVILLVNFLRIGVSNRRPSYFVLLSRGIHHRKEVNMTIKNCEIKMIDIIVCR